MVFHKEKGVTLVELMIVVAIVAIIASIAYPSYQGAMAQAARGAAQADLMALASAMERHSAANFTYDGAASSKKPTIFASHSPSAESSGDKKYDLTIESADAQTYTLRATPVNGSVVDGDGFLEYYSDGRKAWDVNDSNSITSGEFCWSC